MRWTVRIGFVALLAWAIFMVSPFLALYELARAVEARDVAALGERVNFHAVRLSLTKQIVNEYLRAVGRGHELDGFNRNLATSAGASLADPLIAQLVTPEAVAGLLRGRLPQAVAAAAAEGAAAGASLDVGSARDAWRIFVTSQSRGFRNIFIPLSPDRPAAEQVRLHLRLVGAAWVLFGVELPQELVRALARQLPRAMTRDPAGAPTRLGLRDPGRSPAPATGLRELRGVHPTA